MDLILIANLGAFAYIFFASHRWQNRIIAIVANCLIFFGWWQGADVPMLNRLKNSAVERGDSEAAGENAGKAAMAEQQEFFGYAGGAVCYGIALAGLGAGKEDEEGVGFDWHDVTSFFTELPSKLWPWVKLSFYVLFFLLVVPICLSPFMGPVGYKGSEQERVDIERGRPLFEAAVKEQQPDISSEGLEQAWQRHVAKLLRIREEAQ